MANNAVVGSLRISLGLDSAQFSSGLKNAQTGLQRFASLSKTAGLAIGTAMVAAGGAMALAMRNVINEADEMSKLAQAIGVPVDDLSRLAYAADLSGVSVEDLGKAVKRLSAGMYEASQNATGGAADAFRALGVDVADTEGRMRSASSVITDLAGRFALMPDGVEKTALAMKVFGKSGADMIPLLNSGSDGLRDMYAEAERLGIVLDEETAKAAERFNDNLTRLGKTKDGIVTKITAGMLPALEDLSSGMVTAAKDSDLLRGTGHALGWTLKALASVALATGGTFYAMASAIGMAGKAMYAFARGQYGAAAGVFAIEGARVQATLDSLEAIHDGIWNPRAGGGGPPPAVEGLQLIGDNANGARRSVARLTDAERETARAADDLASAAERTFAETRTPLENYLARLRELDEQLAKNKISQDTYTRAVRMAGVALDSADPLSQAGARIAEENRLAAAASVELSNTQRENLYDATYDGVRGGLEAAADGNLGQYLAGRIREALFDNLATTLTDLFRGARNGSTGTGFAGWASTAASLAKTFSRGLPSFSKGVENFGGGLAYVHKGEVLANLPKGTSVIPARDVQAGGGAAPLHVIVTADQKGLTAYIDGRATPIAARSGFQSVGTARQLVPADDARRRRFSLTGGAK